MSSMAVGLRDDGALLAEFDQAERAAATTP
jgi:hypothetical protein